MSSRARRRFLRAYSVRIARSSSSTSSVSRRVTPTEPDISRFQGTTCQKVDPAGHAALSKLCFHSGRVSTSPFLCNISQKSDSQKRRQGSGSYPAHSSGQVLVGTGFVRTRPSGGPSCGPSHPLSAPVTPMHDGSRPSRPLSHSRHNPGTIPLS